MKRFVRVICFIMAVAMVAAVPVSAQEVTPYSSRFFASYGANISIVGGRTFEVWFSVTAKGTMDKLGTCEIAIQQSSDQSNWETLFTFTPSYSPQMLCENTGFHCDCVTFSGVAGCYYRAKVTFYAENSTGSGMANYETTAIYLRPTS